MAGEDIYTNDGTVDIYKKPAIKEKTGNWRACRLILGIRFLFSVYQNPKQIQMPIFMI